MTENPINPLEQDSQAAGTAAGSPSGSEAGSANNPAIEERLKTLEGRLNAERSDVDRAANRILEQLPENIARYARHAGIEVDPDAIMRLQVEDLVAAQQGQVSAQAGAPASAPPAPVDVAPVDAFGLVQAAGLDANDQNVLDIVSLHGQNHDQLALRLLQHKQVRSAQPTASPASVAATPSGVAPPSGDENSLIAAYNKEAAELPIGPRSARPRSILRDKYLKLGVTPGKI